MTIARSLNNLAPGIFENYCVTYSKGVRAALAERSAATALLSNEEVQVKRDLSDGALLWIYNNRGVTEILKYLLLAT